jgi:two-component system, sensor histidine kinase
MVPAVQVLTLVALLVLWRATGFRTTLQVWLGVVLVALLLDNAITMLEVVRFTVGWYVGRFNALLSALVLLVVYIRHIGVLQDRLAIAAALAEDKELLERRVAERTHDLVQAVEERQRAVVVAERATAAKTLFFTAASHDLRQTFQSLRLYHYLLQQRSKDRESDRLLAGQDAAISAGEELLHSVLAVSFLDAGVVKPDLKPVRLDEILDSVALDSRGTAEPMGVSLRLRTRPLWVETDPVLLKRAIRNLVANAIRYNKPNGKVLLSCRARCGQAVVQVWDTGVGIPADRAEDIFEEYVQLGNPERDLQKGLGLGLAIVRRTAEVLGCDLTYRSVMGRGTVFSMALALANPPDCAAAAVPVDTPAKPLDNRLVLVVEDDYLQALGLCEVLEGSGYRTHSMIDAHSALKFVATAKVLPNVVICDLRLPGDLDGLQLARRLSEEVNGRIPAVIVSGDTDEKYADEAKAAGCRLLHKPYRPEDLCRAVNEALGQSDQVIKSIEVSTC